MNFWSKVQFSISNSSKKVFRDHIRLYIYMKGIDFINKFTAILVIWLRKKNLKFYPLDCVLFLFTFFEFINNITDISVQGE